MRSKRESKYLMTQRFTLKHLRKKTSIPIWFSGLHTHQSKGRHNKYLQQKQTFSRWNLNFKIWPQKKKKKKWPQHVHLATKITSHSYPGGRKVKSTQTANELLAEPGSTPNKLIHSLGFKIQSSQHLIFILPQPYLIL